MDLPTVLIGLVVFVISALLIYFISAISMKEKTFEEVIEEQKRRQEEESKKVKAEKKAEREHLKKRFKKGKQDKVKDPVAVPSVEPEPIEEQKKMVNLEIEPEIIEPTESLGLGTAPRINKGKSKDKASKPSILLNKDEVPLVAEKTVEVHHKPIVPKDDVELKRSHEVVVEKMQKAKAPQVETQPKEKKSKMPSEIKENLPPVKGDKRDDSKTENLSKHRSDEVDKRLNKSKQADDSPMPGSRVISLMKTAKLTDNEVQTLIDILLNKQGLTPSGPFMSDDSWNKKSQKGDPVSSLKKQLEEKEKALQDEQNSSLSANARLKEIKQELMSEKTKHNTTGKQLQEKKSEFEALQSRLQRSHEQHLAESKNLQAKLKHLDQGGDKAVLQKLTNENKVLQETLSIKAKESVGHDEKVKQAEKEVAVLKSKVQSAETSRKTLESKLSASDAKVKKLETGQKDVDSLISKRVDDVAKELRKTEATNANLVSDLKKEQAKNAALSADVQNTTGALATAQGEVGTLKGKLEELQVHLKHAEANKDAEAKFQDSERKRSDLERNVKNLEKQLHDISSRLSDTDTVVERLKQENQTLSAENKTVNEKLQSASAPNGDINEGKEPSVSISEHERLLSEKKKEVEDMVFNLESQKKAAGSLQVQLDNKQSEFEDLKCQLEKQITKNNELREKNWKAMDALEKAEKTSAEKYDRALKSARDSVASGVAEIEVYDKAVFQRLFPGVQIAEKGNHKEWVSLFEKQAAKKLDLSSSKDQVKQLEEENKRLQATIAEKDKQKTSMGEEDNKRLKAEVDHYQNVVEETANKLKQLEKSVDAEQRKWQERLKEAQSAAQKNSGDTESVKRLESVVAQQEAQLQEYRGVLASTEDTLQSLEAKVSLEEKSWQGKLDASQSELKKVQDELTSLRQELLASHGSQEMQIQLEETQEKLKETEEKIKIITQEKESVVQQIQVQLDAERKKSKDLSLNVVKLNGIIKTGHDALTEEQSLVKQLQEQLDTKSVHSGTSEADEMDQAASSTENGTSV